MNWENSNNSTGIKYLTFCKEAATNDFLFSKFKINPNYTPILSHVSYEEGLKYLEESDKDIINLVLENDKYGSPPLVEYGNLKADPTSLRYARFITHIRKYLGEDLGNVLEIGGGYGGLCLGLNRTLNIKSYSIADDENVYPLIDKYLSLHNLKRATGIPNFDTVISTYAWDELEFNTRNEYVSNINDSVGGYIIGCNDKLNTHSWPDRYVRIPDSVTPNYSIIYWRNK